MITVEAPSSLRRLSALLGAAIVTFGLLLLAIVGYAGWAANTSAVERDKNLVKNALDESVAQVLNEQKSISWWDDAVVNVSQHFNFEWTETNFGIFLFETYGHDEIFIFDAENKLAYKYSGGEEMSPELLGRRLSQIEPVVQETRTGVPSGLAERLDAFGPNQKNYEVMSGVLNCARWRGHILSIEGRPAVVTGITICPTVEFGLLQVKPALLISVAYIDQAFVSEIGRSLLLPDLRLVGATSPDAGLASEPFVTDDGTPSGAIVWSPKRPGQPLLTIVLPLVALGAVGTGLLSSAMLRRLGIASAELAKREAAAIYQAEHDALSGLPNRHKFAEELQAALHLSRNRPEQSVTVAYIDVDRFKDINDTLGHQAGDELIKMVGVRLGERLSPGDLLARFGGDEFAVLRGNRRKGNEGEWVHSLSSAFEGSFPLFGQNLRVSSSIGIASAPAHGTTPEELMRNADIALYAAKAAGRDQEVFFSKEMGEDVQRRRNIEVDLRAAIGSDQLSLHYQPVVSCKNYAVTGVEALLRWQHPTDGMISPAVFIPIAEHAGLMPALGAWVLERALQDARQWPDLEVAVNLSPAQFSQMDLTSTLKELTAKHAVDPGRIVLEITEGLLMEYSPRRTETLEAIRALGFKLALDDFGTGYSSLNYLHVFRFDKLKIDRSFMQSLSTQSIAKTIFQAAVSLGRNLGMDVIAEGVETEAEAAMIQLFKCTAMQGFFFSKAVPADAVAQLCQEIGNSHARIPQVIRPPRAALQG